MLLDYIESMHSEGVEFYVHDSLVQDEEGDLKTPLSHKIHHPAYIVNRSAAFQKEYLKIMRTRDEDDEWRADMVRKLLEEALSEQETKTNTNSGYFPEHSETKPKLKLKVTPLSEDLSQLSKAVNQADEVSYFGGASLNLLSGLMKMEPANRATIPPANKTIAYCQGVSQASPSFCVMNSS